MCILNEQGINLIKYTMAVYPFCPLGNEAYHAEVTVEFEPADLIMDYLDEVAFINSLNNKQLIVEDLVATVFNHLQVEYKPKNLLVRAYATTAYHFPVTVEKHN